jgi:uncharacterized glyoxalase superfamily protein PhnB
MDITRVPRRLERRSWLDLKTQDYGGRDYTCRDLEGHVWTFGTYDPWAS